MTRRLLLAAALTLLCAALFATRSHSAARFVNRSTGSDQASGLSGSPWQTIAWANAHVSAGESVTIAANDTTYDAQISPLVDGTTWIGDSTNMLSGVRPHVHVPGASIAQKFTTLNGIDFRGSVVMLEKYGHLRNSVVAGNLTMRYGGAAIIGNRVGTDEGTSQWYIEPDSTVTGDSIYVSGNYGAQRIMGSGVIGDHVIHWSPDTHGSPPNVGGHITGMLDWYVANNRDTITMTHGQSFEKTMFISRMRRGTFRDNLFYFRDSTGSPVASSSNQTFVVRDSMKLCTFLRDTVQFEAVDPTSASSNVFWYSSGSLAPDSSNAIRWCLFKSNVRPNPNTPATFFQQWRWGARDSVYRNTFLCDHGGDCVFMSAAGATSTDTAFFERNTVYQHGTGRSIKIEPGDKCDATSWPGVLRAYGNLYVTNSNEAVYVMTKPLAPGYLLSDYSTLWDRGLPVSLAIKFAYCSHSPVWYSTPLASVLGEESHGKWGSPVFVDSSYAAFDPNLGYGSAAIGAGPAGVDAGAYDYVAAAPSAITDLATLGATSSEVLLTFSAPGGIGTSGIASSYDVRYSTSEINDGNFTSATSFGGTIPTPSTYGTLQLVRVTGLASRTTYYFAVRASNGVRTSLTSNSVSATTWRPNTIEP